jgi:hypothetical protein
MADVSERLESLVIQHTLRVPAPAGPAGAGGTAARQFDVALMSVGFKLSADLLRHLSGLAQESVVATATRTLKTVRQLVGDHVRHNTYFKSFPARVPDTFGFWMQCITSALVDEEARPGVLAQLSTGVVDLLTLPSYGDYQYTYDEMLAVHEELIAAAGDRMTVLHLGRTLDEEISALYLALAGSTTPLGEEVLRDLAQIAELCVAGPQPEAIPVRENRAVINVARVGAGAPLLVDTVTDVLRAACALSGGDVTLAEPTKFAPIPRPVRRALLAGLDAVVAASPAKLADVTVRREAFKRLGERLHPHEYPRWPHAADVFAVARGEKQARSIDGRLDELLALGDVAEATRLLSAAPGKLFRSLDRLLRAARTPEQADAVVIAADQVAPEVSARVVLSVREHLANRDADGKGRRVFVNRAGGAWVTADTRPPLPQGEQKRLLDMLDAEMRRRLPAPGRLLVDPDVLDVALPLSGNATAAGLGVLPRGSVSRVDGELLRFFVYWKQTRRSTDFDLSALLLDDSYGLVSWLSFTALTQVEGEHSGDITSAPHGASEFINLRLGAVRGGFIIPQVNIYAGENFETVAESFFGYMTRDTEQKGAPFEARTVRMKSELRGPGRVAVPLVFRRGKGGRWQAKWLHLHLTGLGWGNMVEQNRVSVATVLRGIVEREYLTVRYLVDLWGDAATSATVWDGGPLPDEPVTFIGLERPEGLHPESVVYTRENLRDLIPA